ncbi:hypothetical protein MPH_09157 [Macrophomina phaseolina MS6]|uniref:Uncharacterized protein n=1 Tax=Macrophomina phaseolina (strain MS6) TaxID=1126212 RepID=K2QVG4_MACPH|nr:hypothetical protein MPH_09157 [Macrophomina phaseolina MS6]
MHRACNRSFASPPGYGKCSRRHLIGSNTLAVQGLPCSRRWLSRRPANLLAQVFRVVGVKRDCVRVAHGSAIWGAHGGLSVAPMVVHTYMHASGNAPLRWFLVEASFAAFRRRCCGRRLPKQSLHERQTADMAFEWLRHETDCRLCALKSVSEEIRAGRCSVLSVQSINPVSLVSMFRCKTAFLRRANGLGPAAQISHICCQLLPTACFNGEPKSRRVSGALFMPHWIRVAGLRGQQS